MIGKVVIPMSMLVAVGGFLGPKATAGRLYGNANLSYQHFEERSTDTTAISLTNDIDQQTVILNYEDVLFTKNQMRLGLNLNRQKYSGYAGHEYRPIYYLDLQSFGYSISSSYSPYKTLVHDVGITNLYYQSFRDWRFTLSTNYPKYPTLGATYSSSHTWYQSGQGQRDQRSRTTVLQSSYALKGLAYQASYSALRSRDILGGSANSLLRTVSSTVGYTRSQPKLGSLTTSYNLYLTRQYAADLLSDKSRIHSINAIYGAPMIAHFTGSASYAGRFTRTDQQFRSINGRSENFSGQLSYTPTSYLSVNAVKGYQIGNDGGRNDITEYLALTGDLSRFIRKGVDTRVSLTRTIFQQSDIAVATAEGSAVMRGRYSLNVLYGSVALGPYNYMKTYLEGSITHNDNPFDPFQRYQMTGSADTRMTLSQALEARVSVSTQYQGPTFRLGHSFSETYNVGATYVPQSNINVNVTYIYTTLNTVVQTVSDSLGRNTNGSFTGYIGYSFRRAFSLYVSVNRQSQAAIQTSVFTGGTSTVTRIPHAINGQLQMYLSPTITLSLVYLYTRRPTTNVNFTTDKSIQTVLNIQI